MFVKPLFSSNGAKAESWDAGVSLGSITGFETELCWLFGERVPSRLRLFVISLYVFSDGLFESN